MAAPIDIPKKENDFLASSPLVSIGTYNNFKSCDSGIPLQTPWTLWLDKTLPSMSADEYKDNLKRVYTFSTIQGFWAVFNNVPTVDEIKTRYSYHLMRNERLPLWEDPENKSGGTWRVRCNKRDTAKVWKELLLATIGEQLTDSLAEGDEIVGLTVSVREKMDVIHIWNQCAHLEPKATVIAKIGRILYDVDFQEPIYKEHQTHHAYDNTGR